MMQPEMFRVPMVLLAMAMLSFTPIVWADVPVSIGLADGPVSFRVSSPGRPTGNAMTIRTSGLKTDNRAVTRAIDGTVADAELADLDGDGAKELLVHVVASGTGQYGEVVAYSTNGRKSLSEISVFSPGEKALAGYGGHDEWKPAKRGLLRSFPVYREGDAGAAPTGGQRAITYELRKGKTVWQLVPVRVRNR